MPNFQYYCKSFAISCKIAEIPVGFLQSPTGDEHTNTVKQEDPTP